MDRRKSSRPGRKSLTRFWKKATGPLCASAHPHTPQINIRSQHTNETYTSETLRSFRLFTHTPQISIRSKAPTHTTDKHKKQAHE
jgi:hypothetical protein